MHACSPNTSSPYCWVRPLTLLGLINGQCPMYLGGPEDVFDLARPVLEFLGTSMLVGSTADVPVIYDQAIVSSLLAYMHAISVGDALIRSAGLPVGPFASFMDALDVRPFGKRLLEVHETQKYESTDGEFSTNLVADFYKHGLATCRDVGLASCGFL